MSLVKIEPAKETGRLPTMPAGNRNSEQNLFVMVILIEKIQLLSDYQKC